MSIDRWMEKEDVVHIHNGILLSNIKESIRLSSNKMNDICWTVAQSCQTLSDHMDFARLRCPSPSPGAQTHVHWINDCIYTLVPCHHILLLPSHFPASGPFQMSQLFTSGGQSIEVSASESVLPMNIQDWLPLGWTGWISLQSKGLSRAFSNTTVQKLQFFSAQPS